MSNQLDRVLYWVDPHVQISNLEESERLAKFVEEKMLEFNAKRLVILGDLFNNHSVVRLEILQFWNGWLKRFSSHFPTFEMVVLCGNHDMVSHYSTINSLNVFKGTIPATMVTEPYINGIYGYLPYIHNNEEFIKKAIELHNKGAKVLISHTTYEGSKFENGMYAPEGVNVESVPFTSMISGHIHSRQRYITNKGQSVIYPGTARWSTQSDANQPKGLWLVDHLSDGSIAYEEFLDTSSICIPIVSIAWKENEETPKIPENAKVTLELIGSSKWVTEKTKEFKGLVNIKTKIVEKKEKRSRQSGKNLEDFINNHFDSDIKDKVINYMRSLSLV